MKAVRYSEKDLPLRSKAKSLGKTSEKSSPLEEKAICQINTDSFQESDAGTKRLKNTGNQAPEGHVYPQASQPKYDSSYESTMECSPNKHGNQYPEGLYPQASQPEYNYNLQKQIDLEYPEHGKSLSYYELILPMWLILLITILKDS